MKTSYEPRQADWQAAKDESARTGKNVSTIQEEQTALSRGEQFIIQPIKAAREAAEKAALAASEAEAKMQTALEEQRRLDSLVLSCDTLEKQLGEAATRVDSLKTTIAESEQAFDNWPNAQTDLLWLRRGLASVDAIKLETDYLAAWIPRAEQRLKKAKSELAEFCRENGITNPL
jgi:hypothetical protein